LVSGLGQERVRLWPSFYNAWLLSVRAVTDDVLQATLQHCFDKLRVIVYCPEYRKHFVERLHGVLEADLPRLNFALHGCFAHQLSDQIMGDHMGPNLVSNAMWFFAASVIHLHSSRRRSN
jgi:hypothetical protein